MNELPLHSLITFYVSRITHHVFRNLPCFAGFRNCRWRLGSRHTSRRWVGQIEAGFTIEDLQNLPTDLIVAEAAPANLGQITQNEIDAVAGNGDIDVRSQSSEINMKPPGHTLLASSGLFDKFAGNPLGHVFDDFASFFPIAFISDGDMNFVPDKRVSGRVIEEMVLEDEAIGEENHT